MAASIGDGRAGQLEPLARWLSRDSTGLIFWLICAVTIVIACAITWAVGLPHIAVYGRDNFIMLDGGWRILNGQRPGTDFYSAFGPLSYLLTAAGFALTGKSLQGVVIAAVITGLALGFWTLSLVRRRLPAWAAYLAVLFLTLLWLAPFPIGEVFYLTSYAMQYNRLGYVLLSLILLEFFGARTNEKSGFSSGVAAALLLFLKMNFFVVAVLLIGVAYLITDKNRRHFVYLLSGFGLMSAAMLWYFHWDCSGMMRDVLTAAMARRARVNGLKEVFRILIRNATDIAALLGVAYLSCVLSPRTQEWSRRGKNFTIIAFVGIIFATDFLLSLSNTQRSGFPLSLIAILLLSARMGAGVKTKPEKDRLPSTVLSFLAVFLLLPTIVATLNSWAMVLAEKSRRLDEKPVSWVATPVLRGLIFNNHADPTGLDHETNNGEPYTSFVNEGLALLRANSNSSDRVLCLCFANPFSYGLFRQPARGGATFLEYTTNFTEEYAPSAKRILGNAEVVMYPKGRSSFLHLDLLLKRCTPELNAHYRKIAESKNWTMFKRSS